MFKRYHEPIWNINNIQDPLPNNWKELSLQQWNIPENFGTIDPGKLYRSAIIYPHQIKILQARFQIWHIISLIDGDWLEEYYDNSEITIHQFPILERKALTKQRIAIIIDLIKSLNSPALIHCLKGATRTGMISSYYEITVLNKNRILSILNWARHWNVNISAIREIMNF